MSERIGARAGRLAIWLLAGSVLGAGCTTEPDLETRTFELMYLDDGVAAELIGPYVYFERDGAAGAMTVAEGKLTVRETSENLERIGGVLAEFDKPKPGVRLRFQLIEANGFEGTDPEILEIESALRDLFRFQGYRLVGDALVNGVEGSYMSQDIPSTEGQPFHLQTGITDVRTDSAGGSIALEVLLEAWGDDLLATTVRVRAGQTAVLGSAASRGPDRGATLILAVRPELVSVE